MVHVFYVRSNIQTITTNGNLFLSKILFCIIACRIERDTSVFCCIICYVYLFKYDSNTKCTKKHIYIYHDIS